MQNTSDNKADLSAPKVTLHSSEFVLFKPVRVRNLSMSYFYNGKFTAEDPQQFRGQERIERENAVLRDLSDTGYADRIREQRQNAALSSTSADIDTELSLSECNFN